MLQWGGWFHTKKIGFIHTYEKFAENIEKQIQLKEEALSRKVWAGHLYHRLQYPTIQMAPLSQLQAIMVLSLGLRFLSFFKGALLPNFNKIVKRELLVMGARHIFGIVAVNVHAWLNVLCLATNDISWDITLFTLQFFFFLYVCVSAPCMFCI
jgi:hypothetical protein